MPVAIRAILSAFLGKMWHGKMGVRKRILHAQNFVLFSIAILSIVPEQQCCPVLGIAGESCKLL